VTLPPFVNEPVLELRRASVRAELDGALAQLDAAGPRRVPVDIAAQLGAADGLLSTDPGAPSRVVAIAGRAGAADVDAAVAAAASDGAQQWRARGAQARASVLREAASLLRARRLELAALALRECAKPWPEADADVCEAIDFLEYYARATLELERERALDSPRGERNTLSYVARGVVAVVAPWNFPLAIPCGMTAAALACGNSVVLKPAEQSPACAAALVAALREAGVPPAALSLLPGDGETGAALVRHPGVQAIAFTGSQAVGLEIARAAAEVVPGQRHLKRLIAELGGKNCVIVDADADLDEAVPAIVSSAFAYAGQKCSAVARVLCHEATADTLLERLAGAVELLRVGQADQLETDVPPLIERSAQERVDRYTALASASGALVARCEPPAGEGWFSPVTLFADLPARSPLLREEIFGPLLCVERVSGIAAACDRVEELDVALTGGLFTRNPSVVREVRARSPVGNLYVNRAITGAIVGRQPFGGNRLSGTGSKAGGPDYLLQFVEPRVVSENTMRHGLEG
jgi:predicted delta-1-pyrroline-5-carboxylate dehydrogenase group 2